MGGCGGCCDESAFKRIDGRLDDLWNRISLITSEITKVPTKVSDLINDLDFISCADLATCQEIIDIKASIVTDISELTDENDLLFSGDYNDLTNIPPPVPSTITTDIISDVTAGAIEPGDLVAQGSTLTDFAQQLLLKTFFPTFVSPAFSGTTPAKEVGTGTVPISMQYTSGSIVGSIMGGIWNPGVAQGPRAGARNKVWIDGVDNGTALVGTKNQLTTLGTNTVPIKVDYDAGMQPTDSKGNNYLTALPPGSITNNVTWTGFYYRTGISGTTVPTATDIRNNYTTRRTSGGVINLATGTTAKRFDVFVPQGSVLSSAIDEGNLNLDITSEFVLQTDFSGLDANGDVVMYKHYLRQVGNAYTASSNLKITVT